MPSRAGHGLSICSSFDGDWWIRFATTRYIYKRDKPEVTPEDKARMDASSKSVYGKFGLASLPFGSFELATTMIKT